MRRFQLLLIGLFALTGLLMPKQAHALTICWADVDNIRFDVRQPEGRTEAQGTLTYQCLTISEFARTQVQMCFEFGAGTGTGSTVDARRMSGTVHSGDSLAYQLYKDPARTSIWGQQPTGAASRATVSLDYGGGLGYQSGSIPIYGLIPPQTGVASGDYASSFAAYARMRYSYRESNGQGVGNLRACDEGGTGPIDQTLAFTAEAQVAPGCTVLTAAAPLDFTGGSPVTASRTGTIGAVTGINLTCRRRTAWQVGLDRGLHHDGATRRMSNGSAFLRYELRQTASGIAWGDTLHVDTLAGTGTGAAQSLTVHGHVADQPVVQAGRYRDTVKVTVTY